MKTQPSFSVPLRLRAASLLGAGILMFTCAQSVFAGGPPIIGPQVRVDVEGGTSAANEFSSAAGGGPASIVATWNDWRQSTTAEIIRMGVALSTDGGSTWSDFLVRPPVPNQSTVEGDPMTAFDPRTQTLWVGAISFTGNGGVYVARKQPGDATFQPSVMARVTAFADKCWMAAGPRPGLPDTTRLYVAYNEGVIWSDDLGQNWMAPVSLGSGIGFLPRVGPGGELYVAYWDGGSGVKLKRSLTGGSSFTTHTIATRMDWWGTQDGSRFPGTFRVPCFTYLAVDPNTGTLYSVYFDTTNTVNGSKNVDLYFTKSENQGTTWSVPVVINGDASPPGDQFFPFIEVDQQGRIHAVFFDGRHTVQNDTATNGMFDAYYSYSADGGDTWSEHRLSPASWNSNNDGLDRPSQFIGDYTGLAVVGSKVFPTYMDTTAGDPNTYVNVVQFPNAYDITGDGIVNIDDLFTVLAAWGACADPENCPADLDDDDTVNIGDLFILVANWD